MIVSQLAGMIMIDQLEVFALLFFGCCFAGYWLTFILACCFKSTSAHSHWESPGFEIKMKCFDRNVDAYCLAKVWGQPYNSAPNCAATIQEQGSFLVCCCCFSCMHSCMHSRRVHFIFYFLSLCLFFE